MRQRHIRWRRIRGRRSHAFARPGALTQGRTAVPSRNSRTRCPAPARNGATDTRDLTESRGKKYWCGAENTAMRPRRFSPPGPVATATAALRRKPVLCTFSTCPKWRVRISDACCCPGRRPAPPYRGRRRSIRASGRCSSGLLTEDQPAPDRTRTKGALEPHIRMPSKRARHARHARLRARRVTVPCTCRVTSDGSQGRRRTRSNRPGVSGSPVERRAALTTAMPRRIDVITGARDRARTSEPRFDVSDRHGTVVRRRDGHSPALSSLVSS